LVETTCPLCSQALGGVDYVAHLRDAHGLVDDPGTSSSTALAAEPEAAPAPPALHPLDQASSPPAPLPPAPQAQTAQTAEPYDPVAATPALPRGVTLAAGEVLVAFVEGGGPPPPQIGGRKKSIIVGGVIGGAVGAAVGAAVAGSTEKFRGSAESRTLVLTNQRLVFLRFHIAEIAVPVDAIKSALVKGIGPLRRALVVKVRNGSSLRLEGDPTELETFAASLRSYVAYAAHMRRSGPP